MCLQEAPEQGAEVVEDQASRSMLGIDCSEEGDEQRLRWCAAVAKLGKSVLGEALCEPSVLLNRPSPVASRSCQYLDALSGRDHLDAVGQPEKTTVRHDALPTQAVVVGDLDVSAMRSRQLTGRLCLKLSTRLSREGEEEHALGGGQSLGE